MCDYSLEAYRSRPARKGERYVTHRFESGSIGLTAAGDRSTAVCVAPDMQLRLQGLPKEVQDRFDVGPEEDVSFVRLDREPELQVPTGFFNRARLTYLQQWHPARYRDAVRFDNGAEVLLQDLGRGITAIVTASLEDRAEHRKVLAWV